MRKSAGKGQNLIEESEQKVEPLPEFAVKLEGVSFTYADGLPNAVENVSLEVERGQFVAILGHNGSGKSTLAKLICGLLPADSGRVTVWGYDPADREGLNAVRTHAGVVFQNPDNQMVASIVEDDVAFGPENLGIPREEIGRRIDWALNAVGMSQFRRSTPARLSGGQKQRIAVAGALAIKPDVLILDESTAMLDPKGRREVIDVAARLNAEEGMTVILITHFMEEALLAHKAFVMSGGKIVACGTPQQIFSRGDELESFGLGLPIIAKICKDLSPADVQTEGCLYPEQLALAIKQRADELWVKSISQRHIPAPIENKEPLLPLDVADESVKNDQIKWDIKIRDLTYTYSRKSPFATKALKGVNLDICEGEFFGIIGHTGSGKSTLVQHLNALIKLPKADKHYKKPKVKRGAVPPAEPTVTIGAYDLSNKKTDWRALRADVGMVFQYPEYQLFADTVFADVAFGLKNFRPDLSKEQVEAAVRDSLGAVGLSFDEIKDKSPFDLSGGQKRRVAIAGVIVTRPKILVLDEPAAGLDPTGKREIMALLKRLLGDWCRTVIIVSHDMDEIAENCTRACVISDGAVAACDSPSELFKDGDGLRALGLDVPLTAKICEELKKLGVEVECDYTAKGFASAVADALGGGEQC